MSGRFICSDASIARDEPVVATASQVRGWLLIEVPGAWGADAVNDSELGPHVPAGWKQTLKQRGIRPVCIRRGLADRERADGTSTVFFVVPRRPGDGPPRCWRWTAPVLAAVPHVTDDLTIDAESLPAGWEPYAERLVLVCTNGRHDQCCATRGRPVMRHLRTSPFADELWECSHVGGDRFAANLVILPDSLYFGRCEPEQAEHLLTEHAAGRIATDCFRGRSTYRMPEQAVEFAVRQQLGVAGLDDVRITGRPNAEEFHLELAGIGAVVAHIRRTTVHVDEPVTCGGSPHQDIPHFEVVSIEPRGDR